MTSLSGSAAIPGPDPGACEHCGAWRKAGMNHDCEQERERLLAIVERQDEGGLPCACEHDDTGEVAVRCLHHINLEADRKRYQKALEEIHLIARGQVTQYARAREQVERLAREALDA